MTSPATTHAENAASEYDRKIEEGCTAFDAYIVALDYLEDFTPADYYLGARGIFENLRGFLPAQEAV